MSVACLFLLYSRFAVGSWPLPHLSTQKVHLSLPHISPSLQPHTVSDVVVHRFTRTWAPKHTERVMELWTQTNVGLLQKERQRSSVTSRICFHTYTLCTPGALEADRILCVCLGQTWSTKLLWLRSTPFDQTVSFKHRRTHKHCTVISVTADDMSSVR